MIFNNDLKNKLFSAYTIFIIIASGLVGFFIFKSVVDEDGSAVAAKTIIVDTGGNGNYTAIQAAIDAASVGDTIRVWAGTYKENLIINKTVTIIGNGTTNTTIDGGGSGDVVQITTDWVNISGFKITNGGSWQQDAGLELNYVENCNIINTSILSNKYYGIYVYYSNNNLINNINSSLNDRFGIFIYYSNNNSITNNNLMNNNPIGIYLYNSINCSIKNNIMTDNGIFINGIILEHWNSHFISNDNSVNNKPIYYWKDKIGGTAPFDAGQIILANCSQISIKDLVFTNCSIGILLGNSSNNYILNNTVRDNWQGIQLTTSSNNNYIKNNTCYLNSYPGISVLFSNNNTIISNNLSQNKDGISLSTIENVTIENNTCNLNNNYGIFSIFSKYNSIINNSILLNKDGVYLGWNSISNQIINNTISNNSNNGILIYKSYKNEIQNNAIDSNKQNGTFIISSNNNSIFQNQFINNINHAYDNGNNIWNLSSPIGGNYWDNWTSPDNNSDGFVDNPYIIPGGNNKDYLPILSTNTSKNRVHNINQNTSYSTIQAAINAANAGDTIRVWAGTYYENVIVNKTVTLIGNGTNNSTISGGGKGIVLHIKSDYVNITGFTIINSGNSAKNAGINLDNVNNCLIDNNSCSNNYGGILINSSNDNIITNNTCNSNGKSGIYLYNSTRNQILNCNSSGNKVSGIYVYLANNNTIINCTSTNNIGISGHGIIITSAYNNTISDCKIYLNRMNGISIRYKLTVNTIIKNNFVFVNNGNGISLDTSSNNIIYNNWLFSNKYDGITISSSSNNKISSNNNSDNNRCGILISGSNNNLIDNNTCYNSTYGINLSSVSNQNKLVYNNIINNQKGIYLKSSSDNILYRNNFLTNIDHSYDDGNNFWNTSLPIGGNYWDNWTSPDNNYDGFVDNPFIILGGNNKDHLPISSLNVSNNRVHNLNKNTSYSTIQAAINDANTNDTIRIWAGIYYENVIINKTLTLIGNGTDTTINGCNVENSLRIVSDWTNITNLTVTGAGTSGLYDSGIYIYDADNCTISNISCLNNSKYGLITFYSNFTRIENNFFTGGAVGIALRHSNNSKIYKNNISDSNYGIGLYLFSNYNLIMNNSCYNVSHGILDSWGRNNVFKDNILSGSDYGLHLYYSNSATIKNNSMISCGIYIEDIFLSFLESYIIDDSNQVNYKPVYFWKNIIGGTIPNGSGQILLGNCSNVKIEGQNCSKTTLGIWAAFSNNLTIENNSLFNNYLNGIELYSCERNLLKNNICNNNLIGIGLLKSDFNVFRNNLCNLNEEDGIYLEDSKNNEFNQNLCNNNKNSGISFSDSSNSYGIKLENNFCNNNQKYGISIWMKNGSNRQILLFNNTCNQNYLGIRIEVGSNDLVVNSALKLINNTCNLNDNNGISIISFNNCIISKNKCNFNYGPGVSLFLCNNNLIDNNTISKNTIGIHYTQSNNGLLIFNNISDNDFGLNLTGTSSSKSENNIFQSNKIISNTKNGVYCNSNSNNNRWFHNILISNFQQVNDQGSNIWNNDADEGNYWSDYLGLDNGDFGRTKGDGIGDTNLPHNNLDNYPFTIPYGWLLPATPTINEQGHMNIDGNYSISWNPTWRTTGYKLQEDNSNLFDMAVTIYEGNQTIFDIIRKNNGTYFYRIKAYNDKDEGIWSNVVNITVDWLPAAPTNLQVKDTTGHSVTLTWNENSESDLAGYHVYINNTLVGASGPYHKIHTLSSTTTEYEIKSLAEMTNYHFRIIAFDKVPNNSSFSNIASATTLDVTAPTMISGSGDIQTTTGESFEVFAEISDNIDIELVKIFYSKGSDSKMKEISPSVGSKYIITNQELSINTINDITPWIYYFYAEDTSGNFVYYGTEEDPFIITVIDNDKPVADAGANIRDIEGRIVTLDASNSSDNIEITNYTWTFEYNNKQVELYGRITTFVFHRWDDYEITLTVSDAAGNKATDTLEIRIYYEMYQYINLLSPENQSILPGPEVTLSWVGDCNAPCILTYDVYFGTSPDPPIYESNLEEMQLEVLIFEENVDYYWKVQLIVAGSPGPMSNTWSFKAEHAVPNFSLDITTEKSKLIIQQGDSGTINLSVKNTQDRYYDWIDLELNENDFNGEMDLSIDKLNIGPNDGKNVFLNFSTTSLTEPGKYFITIIGRSQSALEYGLYVNETLTIEIEVKELILDDSDNDNLLDSWEEKWFGDIETYDGDSDPDSDGMTNYQEYLNDTDPTTSDLDKKPKGPEEEDNTSLIIAMILVPIIILILILILLLFIFLKKKKGGGEQPETQQKETTIIPLSTETPIQQPPQPSQQNNFLDYKVQEQDGFRKY
jgi:parallel beta-helix repeat protein